MPEFFFKRPMLPRRNSTDCLALALQNPSCSASSPDVGLTDHPFSLTLELTAVPFEARPAETSLPSSYSLLPSPPPTTLPRRREELHASCMGLSSEGAVSLSRLARNGHLEARLVVLGRLLQAFLGPQGPEDAGIALAVFEASFVECLRRCGWLVTPHQLSAPSSAFQSFSSHGFWRVQAPSGGRYMGKEEAIMTEGGLLMDFHFRELFTVARPLPAFQALLGALPTPFVGTEWRLRSATSMLCKLAAHSLQARQLSTPPWRRARFLRLCYSRGLRVECSECEDIPSAIAVDKSAVDSVVSAFLLRRCAVLRQLGLVPRPPGRPHHPPLHRSSTAMEFFEKQPSTISPASSSLLLDSMEEPASLITLMLRGAQGSSSSCGSERMM
eukprot:RCo007120